MIGLTKGFSRLQRIDEKAEDTLDSYYISLSECTIIFCTSTQMKKTAACVRIDRLHLNTMYKFG